MVANVSDLPPVLQNDHSGLQNLCILTLSVSMTTPRGWDKVYYLDEKQM